MISFDDEIDSSSFSPVLIHFHGYPTSTCCHCDLSSPSIDFFLVVVPEILVCTYVILILYLTERKAIDRAHCRNRIRINMKISRSLT